MRVFVGAGFYGNWTNPWEAFTDMEVRRRTEEAIQELAENYGDFRSFYGFYWPNELGIGPDGHFPRSSSITYGSATALPNATFLKPKRLSLHTAPTWPSQMTCL